MTWTPTAYETPSPEVRADDVRLCSPSSVCSPSSSTSHIPAMKLTDTARGSTGAAAGDYEAAQAHAALCSTASILGKPTVISKFFTFKITKNSASTKQG
ncbi:hypothetical protein DIPPA_34718 [Diplonema papillatum]|nr:hypothetical protein DIPPA_34710 [Diplonema papillatum]KAJ9452474.1 hypothetical protein DIPPA_34718 [Diplonema papillatum]